MRLIPVLALSSILVAALCAQNKPKVAEPLVSVDVIARDLKGKLLPSLAKDEFSIYENGVLQDLRGFESADSSLKVVLLMDCRPSIMAHYQKGHSEFAQAFAGALRPQDHLSIAGFGTTVKVLFDLQPSQKPVKNSWSESCSYKKFYGALDWAVKRLSQATGRKALVVYTNGVDADAPREIVKSGTTAVDGLVDPERDAGFQKILQAARGSLIPISFIAINTDVNPDPFSWPTFLHDLRQARIRMEQLSEASGGRVYFPKKPDEVISMLRQISSDLTAAYTLTYSPTKPWTETGYREIVTRVRSTGIQLQQLRKGYNAR
jgi:Ca-activated chloride channel family protein